MTLNDNRPEFDILNLRKQPNKLWPRANNMGPWVVDWHTDLRMPKDYPIATMGSCFAVELEKWLKSRHGYVFVESERAMDGSGPWGKVYNTAAAAQLVEYATGRFAPQERRWETEGKLLDPMRKWIYYDSDPAFTQGRDHLRRATREVIEKAGVLVLTVGLNEVWGRQGTPTEVFYQVPPRDVYDPESHRFWTMTLAENVWHLQRFIDAVRFINPSVFILITLSPVPLRATFRQDVDVFTANMQSKNTLHSAIREAVASRDGVEYFPSYEIAMAHMGWPFRDDARHVRPQVVDAIMEAFERKYVALA